MIDVHKPLTVVDRLANRVNVRGKYSVVLLVVCLLGFFLLGCSENVRESDQEGFGNFGEMGAYDFDGTPSLVGPELVDFGVMAADTVATEYVQIENSGRTTLEIYDVRVETPFEAVQQNFESDGSSTIGVGDTLDLEIQIDTHGLEVGELSSTLEIESNDPDHPVYRINLRVSVESPCVQVLPADHHDFGTIAVGQSGAFVAEVENCSDHLPLDLEFEGLTGDSAFSITLFPPEDTFRLEAGDSLSSVVHFKPVADILSTGVLHFSTSSPEQSLVEITLEGQGGPSCPVPVIQAFAPESSQAINSQEHSVLNAAPLDTISLSASSSFGPQGEQIEEYEWTLLDYPQDSGAHFEHAAHHEENELLLDLAGEYLVELDVRDHTGALGCAPARLLIQAHVDSDVHIQLVWNTPGDPERHNDHGTDLDLHFLHPDGTWNQAPLDCNWQNRNPIWGDPLSATGNPSLDIDATQGWGPENVNLDGPEPGLPYHVGVNYFTDRGYGPSFATIRVFLFGELVEEVTSQALRRGEFWDALRVEPSGDDQVVIVDEISQKFP